MTRRTRRGGRYQVPRRRPGLLARRHEAMVSDLDVVLWFVGVLATIWVAVSAVAQLAALL